MDSRTLKAVFLFILSYVFLYFIYAWFDFLPKWDAFGTAFLHGQTIFGYAFVDPLFLLAPWVGFILLWVALDAYLHHFRDTFVLSVPFALLYIAASYVSFFAAMMGYFWNNAFLVAASQGAANPFWVSFGVALDFVFQNFMDLILKSPFFVLVLGGLLGWLSFVLIHSIGGEAHPSIPRASKFVVEPSLASSAENPST